jgi:hypothetical protein
MQQRSEARDRWGENNDRNVTPPRSLISLAHSRSVASASLSDGRRRRPLPPPPGEGDTFVQWEVAATVST